MSKEVSPEIRVIDGREWKVTVVPPLGIDTARDKAGIKPQGMRAKSGGKKYVESEKPNGTF